MRYLTLAQADSCYSIASTARLSWRAVAHAQLEEFAGAVLSLSRLAKQQDDVTGWRQFLYPARRARNIATTVPLPFSHAGLGMTPLIDQLERSLPVLRVYGGEDAGELGGAVVAAGRAVLASDDAPLLDAILGIVAGDAATNGVVLPLPDYTAVVRAFLSAMDLPYRVVVLSRHDISGVHAMDRLIVIGPLYWYQDCQYVLTSPRAPYIVVTEWAWYRDQAPAATALEGSRGSAGVKAQPVPIARTGLQVSADDERSPVDWESVSRELSRSGENDPSEPVAARAAVLAGRNAVLLPEEGDRLVWLLDPYAPPEHRVARVDVSDLEPGHVIILRTSGGGDLIVSIADEILGEQAPALRDLQRRWKQGLRSWVQQHGTLSGAAAALRRAGSARANPQNLQNWLSERSLRTDDAGDWHVLMTAASLGTEEERIWRAMGRLHSAHLEAGKSIGRRLREMADTQPLDRLLTEGTQVFELRGGSLTAFRVEGFSPTPVQCSPNRLLVPLQVRDDWLT
jgi:hypothetical protein